MTTAAAARGFRLARQSGSRHRLATADPAPWIAAEDRGTVRKHAPATLRKHAPATLRNLEAIAAVPAAVLPANNIMLVDRRLD